MADSPDTRETLLVRMADPVDHAAWNEFVACYEAVVLRYCLGHGLQWSDAREVVQEVWLVVHRKIQDWRPSGQTGAFRRWLLRTAHHQCLKQLRQIAKADRACGGTSVMRRLQELASPDGEVSQLAGQQDWQRWAFHFAADQVRRAVNEETWRAFWLTAVEGRSPTDAAIELGMRVGTVYTNKCRVLARIRECAAGLSRGEIDEPV